MKNTAKSVHYYSWILVPMDLTFEHSVAQTLCIDRFFLFFSEIVRK